MNKLLNKSMYLSIKPMALALIAAGILSACGGGGGGDPAVSDSNTNTPGGTTNPGTTDPGTTNPGTTNPGTTNPGTTTPPGGTTTTIPAPVDTSASMVMSCVDGAGFQCSGETIIRADNGVGLTSSGVQVFGTSTNDLAIPIVDKTKAVGFALPPDSLSGVAEVRLAKTGTGTVTRAALLLDDFGLTWDGKVKRPQIVETFLTTQGRIVLNGKALPAAPLALPPSSDLTFYNYASNGTTVTGTQANYANNAYFPRANPSRCPVGDPCPTIESSGITNNVSDWRTGGSIIDWMDVTRLHEDGDVHAGDGLPDATGPGVPFPGSKGYRNLANWGYNYVNLGTWLSQDTVLIEEWAKQGNEHNKNRRGVVSFGDVTPPMDVPATGTATYTGIVYGWYAATRENDPTVFRGDATVTVDFATRKVTLTFTNTNTYDSAATPVPVSFTSTAWTGAASTNVANYMTGPVDASGLKGGLSGRYFGPVVTTGTSGAGPAEIGGAFRLSNATTNAAFIGGFIGRKQ